MLRIPRAVWLLGWVSLATDAATGEAIHQALTQLHNLDPEAVRKQRREKFLAMGRSLA